MRDVPEWIGATDDTPIPKRVKLRIWDRCHGRCGLTNAKIMVGDEYDFDHIKEIRDGGENRESNIHVVLRAPHRVKTAEGKSRQAKADRTRFKHITPRKDWPKTQEIRSPGFRRSRFARVTEAQD